jgi:hypothetical protein
MVALEAIKWNDRRSAVLPGMSRRSKLWFLLLVIAQAAHSLEEYVTRLYEVFAPARLASGLVSENPAVGFAVLNAAIVCFGAWCYAGPVRAGTRKGRFVAAAWAMVEFANGSGHLALAASAGSYFSGAMTAVALLVTAAGLALNLVRDRRADACAAVIQS